MATVADRKVYQTPELINYGKANATTMASPIPGDDSDSNFNCENENGEPTLCTGATSA